MYQLFFAEANIARDPACKTSKCASTNLKVSAQDHMWNKCRDGSKELGVHNGPVPYGSSLPLNPSVGIKQNAGLTDTQEPLLFKENENKGFQKRHQSDQGAKSRPIVPENKTIK